MTIGTTQLSVINRALTEISRGNPVTASMDEADYVYATTLYSGAVQTLLRTQDWEFARTEGALTAATGTPPLAYPYHYLYPNDCLRIRQILPDTWDPNDPQATRWDVGTAILSGIPTRLIATTVSPARIIYTTVNVVEAEWDSVFTESLVRYLGSQLALPVAGRPDFSREQLGVAGRLAGAGMDRDS